MSVRISLATRADLATINEIYNHYVISSTCTYQEDPSTMAERLAWFDAHDQSHPITVARDPRGIVVGWGALNTFHTRCAYRFTAENSVYVHHAFHRQGIGRTILADLMERAVAGGFHSVLASISADQEASVALHRAMGFAEVGLLREVGYKFNRWLDVMYLQWQVPTALPPRRAPQG